MEQKTKYPDKAKENGVWCGQCEGTGATEDKLCPRCDGFGVIPWLYYKGPLSALTLFDIQQEALYRWAQVFAGQDNYERVNA